MNLKDRYRGIGMSRLMVATLFSAGLASAGTLQQNQKLLSDKMDSIESRQGVEVGGTVRAVFLRSSFASDQDVNALDRSPDKEENAFSQLDLDLGFRPWAHTRANVKLRMGATMQNYFYNPSKTVSVPWMNVEGQLGGVFYWVVGDFRQQYSPLTLFNPDVEVMYEPRIFSRDKEMARDQALLQGNQRNLQGVNLQYRDQFGEALGEVRAEAMFTRLRRVENLDESGAMGSLLPNEAVSGASQAASMDKYLASFNLEMLPMSKKLLVGATFMNTWDDKNSLTRGYSTNLLYAANGGADASSTYKYVYGPVNPYDSLPQNTTVMSVRAGADGKALLGSSNMILDFMAEYAMSKDDVYTEGATYALDGAGNIQLLTDDRGIVYDTARISIYNTKQTLEGKALLAQLDLGYQVPKTWVARVHADYLMNDSAWFNSLAQSPAFFARRNANIDKDAAQAKFGVYSPLYSTFDAMYHFSPKFSPVATTLGNSAVPLSKGQTSSYNIAPFAKNSWGSSVYTRKELEIINDLADPNLQLALPNGLATANRTGLHSLVTAGYGKDNWAEVQGLFTSLSQVSAVGGTAKAEFSEVGGGAKLNVLGMLGFELPLELSGSVKKATRTLDGAELTSNFMNAGLYWQFVKRFGLTAGFQKIDMELNDKAMLTAAADTRYTAIPVVKGSQMQWMAGLDYTLAEHAWLAINYGVANVENTYFSATGFTDGDGDGLWDDASMASLPSYMRAAKLSGTNKLIHEFTLNMIDASINVEF